MIRGRRARDPHEAGEQAADGDLPAVRRGLTISHHAYHASPSARGRPRPQRLGTYARAPRASPDRPRRALPPRGGLPPERAARLRRRRVPGAAAHPPAAATRRRRGSPCWAASPPDGTRSRSSPIACGWWRTARAIPRIAEERIERPLFIVGLPRTGSTLLHHLLAQDPASRVAQAWEVMSPSPPPERARYETDPRIAQAERQLRWLDCPRPRLQGHPPPGRPAGPGMHRHHGLHVPEPALPHDVSRAHLPGVAGAPGSASGLRVPPARAPASAVAGARRPLGPQGAVAPLGLRGPLRHLSRRPHRPDASRSPHRAGLGGQPHRRPPGRLHGRAGPRGDRPRGDPALGDGSRAGHAGPPQRSPCRPSGSST